MYKRQFLGGATFFFGPIIGAALLVFALVLLSELSKAWLLYVGLVFLLMVMFAPGGVASLIMMNVRVALFGKIKRFYLLYVGLFVAAAIMLAGAAAIVEMIYHMQLNAALGPMVPFAGLQLDTSSATSWVVAMALLAVGLGVFEVFRRRFAKLWGHAQEEIEAEIKRRETA